uniref:S-phase kinase-associated protein 1 n=1 Tax=Scophthalmus maximus TaxID=52904 RepID=A0A8D3A299_SCOMX
MPTIKLQSSDGEIFEVDVEIAKQSVTIKTMLEDLGMDDEGDDDPVPLPNVNAAILKKVIQWCTHHKDDPPPPEDDENKEKRTDDIPGTLFELILVNTHTLYRLLDVTCKTVANMIKGKTPEEIRKTFNIKNDFTEEEEAQVIIQSVICLSGNKPTGLIHTTSRTHCNFSVYSETSAQKLLQQLDEAKVRRLCCSSIM